RSRAQVFAKCGFLIARSFPRPVRRVVLHAQIERTVSLSADDFDATLCEQIGEIAVLLYRLVVLIKIHPAGGVLVREIILGASDNAEELVISMLGWVELRPVAAMPFPDQVGFVTVGLQQRSDRGMLRRNADIGNAIAE